MHAVPAPWPQPLGNTAAQLTFTAVVAIAEAAHLAFEHVNGGIVSHHLLNDPTLPALWNGWGLVLLPALAWLASGRAFRSPATRWLPDRAFLLRMAGALLAGIALSMAFAFGREDIAGGVLLGIALASLVVRAYRPEYLLGFALGMAFTFGGILPLLIGGIIAALSAAVWFGLWPLLARGASALRR